MTGPTPDQLRRNTIRFLAADAVQMAGSGHPGAPMGTAPDGELYHRFGLAVVRLLDEPAP